MPRRLRRRLSGAVALALALGTVGIGYSTVAAAAAPRAQAASSSAPAGEAMDVRKGRELYETSCITCHGRNLQGVQDRGPTLIGVGEAAAYFQVSTGRMPVARQEAQAERKDPKFDDAQTRQIAAYVQSVGGGPTLPTGNLRGDDSNLAEGGELFRLNCASCHNFTGRGIAMSQGKFAPNLQDASEQQIYEAMLTGPQNMPKFSDRQLTPEEKKDIVAYIKSVTNGNNNPGGNDLGGYGPGPETVIAWVVGLGALIGITLWIGARA